MGSSVEHVERELTLLVRRVQRVDLHHREQGPQLLEQPAYCVLVRVHDSGPLRLGALATAFALDVSTVSRQVQALEAAGLVHRDPDPSDRRASLLTITSAGRDALRRTRASRQQLLGDLLATWSAQDLATFAGLLERFNADLST
jgi:DNA-binding MarR family transcriptional regulator